MGDGAQVLRHGAPGAGDSAPHRLADRGDGVKKGSAPLQLPAEQGGKFLLQTAAGGGDEAVQAVVPGVLPEGEGHPPVVQPGVQADVPGDVQRAPGPGGVVLEPPVGPEDPLLGGLNQLGPEDPEEQDLKDRLFIIGQDIGLMGGQGLPAAQHGGQEEVILPGVEAAAQLEGEVVAHPLDGQLPHPHHPHAGPEAAGVGGKTQALLVLLLIPVQEGVQHLPQGQGGLLRLERTKSPVLPEGEAGLLNGGEVPA